MRRNMTLRGESIFLSHGYMGPSMLMLNEDDDHGQVKDALQDRLKELLVYEIPKYGRCEFKTFSTRGLYRYVFNCITDLDEEITATTATLLPRMETTVEEKHEGSGSGESDEGFDFASMQRAEDFDAQEGTAKARVSSDQQSDSPSEPKVTTLRERLGGYLHPRDVRKLAALFSAVSEPELIVRRHVILMNFVPIRAVILRDRLLVIVPEGANSLLHSLEARVKGQSAELANRDFLLNHFNDDDDDEEEEQDHVGSVAVRCQGQISISDKSDTSSKRLRNKSIDLAMAVARNTTAIAQSTTATALNVTKNVTKSVGDATKNVTNVIGMAVTAPAKVIGVGSSVTNSITNSITRKIDLTKVELEEMKKTDWIQMPFELQCLEAVLQSVSDILHSESSELRSRSIDVLDGILGQTRSVGGEDQLRQLKNSVKEMTSRVNGFVRALNVVVDDTKELALMNLSRLISHPERFNQSVPDRVLNEEADEPELLLEAHLQMALSLSNALTLIHGEIEATQEFVNHRLDTIRNRLLLANMIMSVLSLVVAVASLVGSFMGMNLTNNLETQEGVFSEVVKGTLIGSLGLLLFIFALLHLAGTLPKQC